MTDKTTTHSNKSIAIFLLLTMAVTWAVEFALISGGMRFDDMNDLSGPALWLLALMMIPGLSAIIVTRYVEGVPFKDMRDALGLRLGLSTGPYFLTFLLIPLTYAIIYGISLVTGLTEYAPAVSGVGGGEVDLDYLLQVALPLSIVLGPFINLLFGVGEEIGWRGFLLPRLLPMGKSTAYIMLGVIWGVWHAPLVYAGFNYPGDPIGGILMMCVLSVAFGFFINEMTLHYKSTILAGFIHGAFNAQGFGIWLFLFPATHPILGGPFGLVGAACWLVVGLIAAWALPKLAAD